MKASTVIPSTARNLLLLFKQAGSGSLAALGMTLVLLLASTAAIAQTNLAARSAAGTSASWRSSNALFSASSERKELEQTSSARPSVWWASVFCAPLWTWIRPLKIEA